MKYLRPEPPMPDDWECCGHKLRSGLLCEQRKGHWADQTERPDRGHGHPWWHCHPDVCPNRDWHYDVMFKGRVTERYGAASRDGVLTIVQIDGVDATKNYDVHRCVCDILKIYVPKP